MELWNGIVVVAAVAVLLIVRGCDSVLLTPPPTEAAPPLGSPQVEVGFYVRTCPQAETIVRAQVQKRFLLDKSITPALLRMLFHDSFVRGADASILLDSKPGHEAEKEALPNLTIRGFDLMNEVKDAVEAECPGIVSCADIMVLAVRDSVVLAGGPHYEVPTGRLDGKVSIKEEALNLPSPAFPVEQSLESFRQKGLDLEDMVALLGAHTVGVALCGFFNDRLFNFHGTGAADPTMNSQLVTHLSTVCPNPFFTESNADPPINLDQSTPALFDAAYYTQILAGNGILQIDQEITADPTTVALVHSFTSVSAFFPAFIRSIIKMGNIGVKTGKNPLGEVRRKCNVTNSPATGVIPGPATKAGPGGQVGSAPTPGRQVSKPPVVKQSPVSPVIKPPVKRPAPGNHVSKAPVAKPGVIEPPVAKSGPRRHVSRPPVSEPIPARHVTKPPVAPSPAPAVPVRRAPAPVNKPTPKGKSPLPAPPFGHVSKPPFTPATPGRVSRPPLSRSPPGHPPRLQ